MRDSELSVIHLQNMGGSRAFCSVVVKCLPSVQVDPQSAGMKHTICVCACVRACVCVIEGCAHVRRCRHRPQQGVIPPGAVVTDGGELLDVGCGDRTVVSSRAASV